MAPENPALLLLMPGVGSLLACTLIALLTELGRMSRKQSLLCLVLRVTDWQRAKPLAPRICLTSARAHQAPHLSFPLSMTAMLCSLCAMIVVREQAQSKPLTLCAIFSPALPTLKAH